MRYQRNALKVMPILDNLLTLFGITKKEFYKLVQEHNQANTYDHTLYVEPRNEDSTPPKNFPNLATSFLNKRIYVKS